MARQIIRITQEVRRGATQPIALRTPGRRKEQLLASQAISGLSWADWYRRGYERLMREAPDEIETLLITTPPSDSSFDKLSFRLYETDLVRSQELAAAHNVPVRNVLLMSLTMEMLAVDLQHDEK